MRWTVVGLCILALAGYVTWLIAPGLVGDVRLMNERLVEARDVRFSDNRCQTRLFVLSFCSAKLLGGNDQPVHKVDYFIVWNLHGERIRALRAPGGALTTSVGMDYLINRLISFAAMILFFSGIGVFALLDGLRALRRRG